MRWKKGNSSEDLSGYIGAELEIEGNLVFEGQVRLEGKFQGQLKGKKIIIGESGRVTGEIEAEEVICFGHIEGKLRTRTLHLRKTASFRGELEAEKFSVEEGALLEGQFKVGRSQTQPSEGGPEAS